MAEVFTWKVEGLRELGEAMRELSADVARRVATSATGSAAKLVKRRAKANVEASPSVVTRSLLNAIIVKKIPRSQTPLTSEHIVTVRGRASKSKKVSKTTQFIAPHAKFVEYGVPSRNIPAEPFLRPALETQKTQAVEMMKATLKRRIDKVRPKK